MRRIITVTSIIFVWNTLMIAQIGHGGKPLMLEIGEGMELSYSTQNFNAKKTLINFQPPSPEYINIENNSNQKGRPLRFGYPNFVELTPQNSGVLTVLEDGRLYWQLKIKSAGAFSLNVIFDRFHLSQGDTLFIYDVSGTYVLGALTSQNNKKWGGLATTPVPGDELVIEWTGKKLGDDATQLKIGAVNHDFLNIFRIIESKVGDFGDSGPCHTDLSCFDEKFWLLNGRSVCQVIVDGTEYCSGTLLNNTNNDGTPYILTAGHCLGTNLSSGSVVFIFNYEVPQCQTFVEGTKIQSISGSELRAFADQLDFALLELSVPPPDYYRAYYSGWNLGSEPSGIVHTIHHPYGDVKKVAISAGVPIEETYSATSRFGNPFLNDSHWKVEAWAEGTTEPGSSGAGLFLDDGALIGLLSGGSATCSNPVNDYFIRLNKIWDYLPEDTARIDIWLNPTGEDLNSLPGYDPTFGELMRFSHFPKNASPQLKYTNNGDGYWTGPNSLLITDVAERFDEFSSGKIYGIFLIPGKIEVEGSGEIDIKIWTGINTPQNLLVNKKLNIKDQAANREVLLLFDQPVSFSGTFFAGYSHNYNTPVDTFAVYQIPAGSDSENNSFFLNLIDSGWQSYSSFSGNFPCVAWIDVLVGEVVYADSSNVEIPDAIMIGPNPAGSFINIYSPEIGKGEIYIYNQNGKLVITRKIEINDNRTEFRFPDKLQTGVYLLQLKINGKKLVSKLVVRR
ncbi:T9SS type A sorting domain-containing protein [Thermophagus sp. OGC60D27]|uniref:T9SS type A sorting domain-containing protein n=1 Tax=Thermophagus sp. OGC60D27 TaxID=3458415 RepID=UPI004037BC36